MTAKPRRYWVFKRRYRHRLWGRSEWTQEWLELEPDERGRCVVPADVMVWLLTKAGGVASDRPPV